MSHMKPYRKPIAEYYMRGMLNRSRSEEGLQYFDWYLHRNRTAPFYIGYCMPELSRKPAECLVLFPGLDQFVPPRRRTEILVRLFERIERVHCIDGPIQERAPAPAAQERAGELVKEWTVTGTLERWCKPHGPGVRGTGFFEMSLHETNDLSWQSPAARVEWQLCADHVLRAMPGMWRYLPWKVVRRIELVLRLFEQQERFC